MTSQSGTVYVTTWVDLQVVCATCKYNLQKMLSKLRRIPILLLRFSPVKKVFIYTMSELRHGAHPSKCVTHYMFI